MLTLTICGALVLSGGVHGFRRARLGAVAGAALADDDPAGPAATDQAGEQRLADLPAADDRQARAAGPLAPAHGRPTRRTPATPSPPASSPG